MADFHGRLLWPTFVADFCRLWPTFMADFYDRHLSRPAILPFGRRTVADILSATSPSFLFFSVFCVFCCFFVEPTDRTRRSNPPNYLLRFSPFFFVRLVFGHTIPDSDPKFKIQMSNLSQQRPFGPLKYNASRTSPYITKVVRWY
jgi:hypothetical protein